MKKLTRLTLSDLNRVVENSVKRVIAESQQDISLAQKELMKMSDPLSSVGLRLEGTEYYRQFLRMKDEIVALNNMLIKDIRRG